MEVKVQVTLCNNVCYITNNHSTSFHNSFLLVNAAILWLFFTSHVFYKYNVTTILDTTVQTVVVIEVKQRLFHISNLYQNKILNSPNVEPSSPIMHFIEVIICWMMGGDIEVA